MAGRRQTLQNLKLTNSFRSSPKFKELENPQMPIHRNHYGHTGRFLKKILQESRTIRNPSQLSDRQ
jgi:hypothetical protein